VPITISLIHLLHNHEFLPTVIAELLETIVKEYGSPQIVAEIIKYNIPPTPFAFSLPVFIALFSREVGRMNQREIAQDTSGAKNIATFIGDLAELLPSLVLSNMSILLGHLDSEVCELFFLVAVLVPVLYLNLKTVPLSCALELHDAQRRSACGGAAVGFEAAGTGAGRPARGGLPPRVPPRRTRGALQGCQYLCSLEGPPDLGLLVRVCIFQYLASFALSLFVYLLLFRKKLIPLKTLPTVTDIAIGRLEDKGVHVRRSAVQLLTTLLMYNPFASYLKLSEFRQKFDEVRGTLEEFVRKRQAGEVQDDEVHRWFSDVFPMAYLFVLARG
jgi:condensin complex subunit 1